MSEAPVCALPPGLAVPSLTTVLSWAAATLDTHFLTLATQPAAVLQTLLGLKGCVTEDLRVSQRVASLGGALAHIHRHAPLPTFSTAAAHTYSVELLDLSVRKFQREISTHDQHLAESKMSEHCGINLPDVSESFSPKSSLKTKVVG